MVDYVKCQECGIEKTREDKFLDIPLHIRPFASTVAYTNIVRYIFFQNIFLTLVYLSSLSIHR